MSTVGTASAVPAAGTAGTAGDQPARTDDFAAELRERIKAAAASGRQHEAEMQRFRQDVRLRLQHLAEVVESRCLEAVRVSEGHIRTQSPAMDEEGNRLYSLRWIGPGGERCLDVLVNPERLFLQYRWYGDWKEQGVAYTVEPTCVHAFDVKELLRQFVEAAPWLARRFPPPLV